MKKLTVRFETPNPILFREKDESISIAAFMTDLDLSARMAGTCEISDYEQTVYHTDEEAAVAVQKNAVLILQRVLAVWPEGMSVVRQSGRERIAKQFDAELAKMRITAKTEITLFSLTEESRQLYDSAIHNAAEMLENGPFGPDLILETRREGQPTGIDMGSDPFPKYMKPDCAPNGSAPGFPRPEGIADDFMGMGMLTAEQIAERSKSREKLPSQNRSDDAVCRVCGAKRPEGVRFCPECGSKFGD